MSRVQMAINVADIDAAVDFYAKLFNVEPAKRRNGYANFVIDDPALKLVLIEGEGAPGSINHLGVEVDSTGEVDEAGQRFEAVGLAADPEGRTECCYALQDKVWVTDPDGSRWEVYTVLGDSDVPTPGRQAGRAGNGRAGHGRDGHGGIEPGLALSALAELAGAGVIAPPERSQVEWALTGALPFAEVRESAATMHLHVKVADVDAVDQSPLSRRSLAGPENPEPGYVKYSFPGGLNLILSSIPISQDDLVEGAVTLPLPHLDHIGFDLRDETRATRGVYDGVVSAACAAGWRRVSQGPPVYCCHTEVAEKHWVYPPAELAEWARPIEIAFGELKIHEAKMGCDLRPMDPAHPLAASPQPCCGA